MWLIVAALIVVGGAFPSVEEMTVRTARGNSAARAKKRDDILTTLRSDADNGWCESYFEECLDAGFADDLVTCGYLVCISQFRAHCSLVSWCNRDIPRSSEWTCVRQVDGLPVVI